MSRRRKDGTTGYSAVIRIKKGGKVIRTRDADIRPQVGSGGLDKEA